ncbi:sugar ABC transporter permease [Nocardioides sp. WL0053]|uniref:Sugar ABC transporter permease n=1 Tax=Nocardioides jiangsuensis TaxID=2866161 RepID=A0ABS7RFF5_9ACTN|nr:sugar ABC transporter permease [Nocardioides jiangsuensis]MBY9073754.1 sugar ABC transporter permease [Nocardioides jiangsuensis]
MAATATTTGPASPEVAAPAPAPRDSRKRRRESLTAYVFLLPGFALFCLIVAYPLARSFQISLYDWAVVPTQASRFIGLENYARGLADEQFWLSMANAGVYLLVTVPGQLVIGLALAVLLDAKMPARGLFRVLFYVPVITSWVVVALVFKYLFNTDAGVVNWLLVDVLHVADANIAWLQSRWPGLMAVSILGVWKGVGWAMVIFLAALTGVRDDLKEAAALDGAGAWDRFVHVSLPAIRKTLLFVTVLLVIGGFNVFISVLLMTGGGPAGSTEVPLTYMYRQAFDFLDFGYAAALSFLLAIVIMLVSYSQFRLFGGDEKEVD